MTNLKTQADCWRYVLDGGVIQSRSLQRGRIVNIFFLDAAPVAAAQMLCDKHVNKMLIEATQLLCNCHPQENVPYRRTHYNHPCSLWARKCRQNYLWLYKYAMALADEFYFRYGKPHACRRVLQGYLVVIPDGMVDSDIFSVPAQAMPDQYRNINPVYAYRCYYWSEKKHFARWEKGRSKPIWWCELEKREGLK